MTSEMTKAAEPSESKFQFSFRIVHLLYVMVLFGSSLSTFGVMGIVPAFVFTCFWAHVFASKSRIRGFCRAVVYLVIALVLFAMVAPAISSARAPAFRMACSNNLKQLAIAFHNYHDTYNSFPPAAILDESGKPMHSWRVLILPFMGEQRLYDSYRFNEPWDSTYNSQFASRMPTGFACPSDDLAAGTPRFETSYVAVIGDHTMWPKDGTATHLSKVPDGTSSTILLIEANGLHVNWMEPRDVSYDTVMEVMSSTNEEQSLSSHKQGGFFYDLWIGRNVSFADGAVLFLPLPMSAKHASALLRRDDGTTVEIADVKFAPNRVARLRVDNCVRLALFGLIVLFPIPWVWRNPRDRK